jgi:SAM-dependent methyltransferase
VDREASVLQALKARLAACGHPAYLARADLRHLPFRAASFDLVASINVINHGDIQTFRDFCTEMDRVLKPGGHLFVYVSPREFVEHVRLPQSRELEPGTLVDIATPDGHLVQRFPTPEEVRARFARYQPHRTQTILTPIPFMQGVKLPQLVFWAEKWE